MAAKVGLSTVSYGIGVQNRYSAFLEDEDSIALSNIKRPTNENHVVSKQKSTVSMTKSGSAKAAQRSDSAPNNQNKKQDGQQKSLSSQANGQQIKGGDMRRQQRDAKPQHQNQVNGTNNNQAARNHANRNRNHNQDGNATANGPQRFPRNQYNGAHQNQTDNATQQHSKENQSHNGRSMRPNNMRPNTRPRAQNDEKKTAVQQQPHDGQQVNGHLASNDEEKARRQQKRLTNLRFKDPEKRERRNQTISDGADPQTKVTEQNDDSSTDQRGQRNRRDFDKNRARPRRPNGETNGDSTRRENRRERPNRQRNGFGGSHSEAGNKQDKPKPIPNFSDKSDFPSLAS